MFFSNLPRTLRNPTLTKPHLRSSIRSSCLYSPFTILTNISNPPFIQPLTPKFRSLHLNIRPTKFYSLSHRPSLTSYKIKPSLFLNFHFKFRKFKQPSFSFSLNNLKKNKRSNSISNFFYKKIKLGIFWLPKHY